MLHYKARECFIHRKIAGDDFLIPTGQQVFNSNGIIMMNDTASFLWNEIQTEKTVDELCNALAEAYEIECENISSDVQEFIDSMLSFDAVEKLELNI